ncbi:hypothetical protein ZTR_01311 [Talaromyces verruculosus]|nr:hypothetical protein ZTR_01311 [Talaromyces verruculosus]
MAFNQDVDFNETREVEINVIGWAFTGIAIASAGLTLFARGHMAKNLGWDDFFIFLSMGLSIIATTFVAYVVTLGLGRHSAAVVAEKGMDGYANAAKWQIIAFPFNIGSFSFPNISIAILINNILDPNRFRTIIYNGVTLVLWGLIEQNVVLVAACVPTLRPFFRKVFTSKSSRSGNSAGSHLHSSHAFKLSSNAVHSGFQRPKSASEMPLDTKQGIWRTREVTVESEDDNIGR